jgi:hypothetical protein
MDFVLNVLLKNISYLWMIFFIMITAGLAKEHQLFAPAFAYVRNTFRSNKFVVVLLSAIGGILPIAVGVAMSNKLKNIDETVWCFVGDMTFETGIFMENYKYAKNFNLLIKFIVEDNQVSTNTPTIETWGKKSEIPDDIIWYEYDKVWPHYGTGKWVIF